MNDATQPWTHRICDGACSATHSTSRKLWLCGTEVWKERNNMHWTRVNAGQISPCLGSASKKRSGPTSRVCATRGPRSRGNISRSRNPDEWANAMLPTRERPGSSLLRLLVELWPMACRGVGVQARRPTALISSALTCDVTERCHRPRLDARIRGSLIYCWII
jgi:hypothetical protein